MYGIFASVSSQKSSSTQTKYSENFDFEAALIRFEYADQSAADMEITSKLIISGAGIQKAF